MRSSTSSLTTTIYQPEAYIPAADVYIEKEATINDELDKLRLSATQSLFERRDCIIVASVSCIYGLGSPEAYYGMLLFLEKGQKIKRDDITRKLVEILYERTEGDFRRGTFRVRGDIIEVFPTYDDNAYRIEMLGDEVESLAQIDPLFGTVKQKLHAPADLSQDALCDEAGDASIGGRVDHGRAGVVGSGTGEAGAHGRGAAHPSARDV